MEGQHIGVDKYGNFRLDNQRNIAVVSRLQNILISDKSEKSIEYEKKNVLFVLLLFSLTACASTNKSVTKQQEWAPVKSTVNYR